MFKKFINNAISKAKERPEIERQPSKEKTGQSGSNFEEIHDKPFEIDFEQLWEYEFEELHDFIKQYEQFTSFVKNKYNDILGEFLVTKDKLILMEQERKRLVTENEQYRLQLEQLKKFISENQENTNHANTPTEKAKLETNSPSFQKLDQNDDVNSLKVRIEKLINELSRVDEPLSANIMSLITSYQPRNLHNVSYNNEVLNTEEYANSEDGNDDDRGKAIDTDNDVDLDSARHEAQGVFHENMELQLKEAVRENLGNALKRIGLEIKNISNCFNELLMKTKIKEKEIIIQPENDALNKSRSDEKEKVNNDLFEKIAEYETIFKEAREQLEEKDKMIEKIKNAYEELLASTQDERKQTKEIQIQIQRERKEQHDIIDELKEAVAHAERAQEEIEIERDELQESLEKLENEYQLLSSTKEGREKELSQELQKYKKNFLSLEEEKKKVDKRIQILEIDRGDIENSLIQEKLKHHQTMADLNKLKEKIEEIEKQFTDEMEGRKTDLKKYEELKKRLVESEKKTKEYKQTIKKLSQQIVDLHNKQKKENDMKFITLQTSQSTAEHEIGEKDEKETTISQNDQEKTETIQIQYTKIHQLEEKLEGTNKELQSFKALNLELKKERDELNSQVKILKDKRELGLQEIKKLSQQLDQTKGGKYENDYRSPTKKGSDQDKVGSQIFQTIPSPTLQTQNNTQGAPDDIRKLRKLKKGLDEVYKDIIMTITNEQMNEKIIEKKASGKLSELVKGPLPSENFMRIEKKMNDSIVILQEYMERFD